MSDERLKALSENAVSQFLYRNTDGDEVKVIRCENCEYGIENGELCGRKVYLCSAMTNPNEFYGDFYCAFGERRENNA